MSGRSNIGVAYLAYGIPAGVRNQGIKKIDERYEYNKPLIIHGIS